MIRRFFSLLLVPMMLANQGACLGHAHHGTGVLESDDHESRPHFHVGGDGHHDSTHQHHADHSHGHDSDCVHASDDHSGDCELWVRPAADHDADALYCSATVASTRDGRVVTVISARYFAVAAILQITHQNDALLMRHGPSRGQPPSVFDAACPIYLRTLSLRI